MTSPRNDSLQSLVSQTSNYMLEILHDNNIRFRSLVEIPDQPIMLHAQIRNNIFLILKEGLHNIIRHSKSGNVEFYAGLSENTCTIYLKDDGTGIRDSMKTEGRAHGNGLVNMRKRAQESGIEFDIRPGELKGTEIFMRFGI
jgi:signal transduction histidine kinase